MRKEAPKSNRRQPVELIVNMVFEVYQAVIIAIAVSVVYLIGEIYYSFNDSCRYCI